MRTEPTRGHVALVGAGPGDPKLLTVRATELLARADVVAYDLLVSEAILALSPAGAELLAVGRRAGSGAVVGRLHPAVLERALAGKRVVRLKSGDPCIFGRGGEEAEELAAAGVPFEVVPGISSAQGAAAAACIPLTHRDYASDVTFATGHAVGDTPRPGTMVLFMAARQLEANLRRVMGGGRPASTPAAFIEQATRPEQRVVVGTLGDLHERVGASADGAPALVIIGDVVRVRAAILEPA